MSTNRKERKQFRWFTDEYVPLAQAQLRRYERNRQEP
jgi:hypothetical protein